MSSVKDLLRGDVVDGTGTANYVSKWSDSDTITNSVIYDDGTNVGIGTSSPYARLAIYRNLSAAYPTYSNPSSVGFDGAFFAATINSSDSYRTMIDIGGVTANTDAISGGSDIRFLTQPKISPFAPTERMRITSGGDVFIGTVGQASSIILNGNTLNETLILRYISSESTIQSVNQGVAFTTLKLNPAGGQVYAGGSRLDNISDERVKENIQPIQNSLNIVLSLNGKKFRLKDEPEDKIRYGFIAQELEGVLDDFIVNTNIEFKDGESVIKDIKSIENWGSSWAALLVESIKEQQVIINDLKARIETLENK